MSRSRRIWGVALWLCTAWVVVTGAQTPEDPKITRWLSDIGRSSERGEFDTVQELRAKLADYAAATGHYDVGAQQYELLLAGRPGRAERVKLFTKLGHMRMALQNYGQAIGAYDDALHDSPKDWDANLARARAFWAADINQRAIESYLRCIKIRPRDAAPYEEMASVYEREGFFGKAAATEHVFAVGVAGAQAGDVSPSGGLLCPPEELTRGDLDSDSSEDPLTSDRLRCSTRRNIPESRRYGADKRRLGRSAQGGSPAG